MVMNILLVEDNRDVSALFKEGLIAKGYTVTCVPDGRAAISALKGGHFDVVVSDLIMPECDGLELLSHLRHEGNKIRVLAYTGSTMPEIAKSAKYLGAKKVLVKPFGIEDLCLSVAEISQ